MRGSPEPKSNLPDIICTFLIFVNPVTILPDNLASAGIFFKCKIKYGLIQSHGNAEKKTESFSVGGSNLTDLK